MRTGSESREIVTAVPVLLLVDNWIVFSTRMSMDALGMSILARMQLLLDSLLVFSMRMNMAVPGM